MRVMCIDDNSIYGHKHPYLVFGEVYEPSGEIIDIEGDECYIILGFPETRLRSGQFNPGPYFLKRRFIPLSEIDELQTQKPEACTH